FPFQVQIFVGDTETYALKASLASPFETSPSFKNAKQEARDKYGTEYVFLTGRLGRIQKMYCDAALGNAKVMQAAKNTDLIVGDAFYICGSLIAAKFSLPFVTVFAMSLSTFTAHGYGLPLTPSYVPQFQSILGDHLSFIGRIQNVYHWILNYWTHYYKIVPFFQDLKVRYKIEPNKSLHEILNRVDLIIAQMGFFLDYPRPLLPNTRVVGPLLVSPPKPLPAELEAFMQSSGNNGVILVSFGSTISSSAKRIDKAGLTVMAGAFAKLPQKIIWKLSEESSLALVMSENIKIASWPPQNDILGHPKTRLFFGHAGLNGILESTYHGVPMICSPFFGDQFDNAYTAKNVGFAEVLHLRGATSEQLFSVIQTVLTDPSYRESAERVSKSIKQLPRAPVQEAADWVEYTQAQGGLQYLRPRGLDLPFYQLHLLDILLLKFTVVVSAFVIVRFLFRFVKSENKVVKTKEKAT
ncbi:unnamed protein product, partial [Porites evermanni]